jgi:capsular polysaccharide export protein
MQNNSFNAYFVGFSLWKRLLITIKPFFVFQPIFINPIFGNDHLSLALKKGLNPKSTLYIWGKKNISEIERYAIEHGCKIYHVEDGFIRSISLGSDLTQPYSLVIDSRGIYFDPTRESDLEYILQNHSFSDNEIERAKNIQHYLIDKKLSKYNLYENSELNFPTDRQIIIIPGQVEDDASLQYGAKGMSNLELLRQTRANRPGSYLVYKPHPDVLVGNRIGGIEEHEALRYCDRIVTTVGIDSVLKYADEVHTMTSLVGFEALLRGINVVTYGGAFYAGWGLTTDTYTCERRTRRLDLYELIAATYILYPRYIDPLTKKRCEIEDVLTFIDQERVHYAHSSSVKIRNWLSRKIQLAIRVAKGRK